MTTTTSNIPSGLFLHTKMWVLHVLITPGIFQKISSLRNMKIFNTAEQLNLQLQKNGYQTIVFTNGVFDLLHPGHIELLESARSQGDCLIVGINDDASVQRLKGDKRPIIPLKERMEVLAAIEWVDFVIPFSEDTPLQLIQALQRIDVLVKGGNYQSQQVVGHR